MNFLLNDKVKKYSIVFIEKLDKSLKEDFLDFEVYDFEAKNGEYVYISSLNTWFVGIFEVTSYIELGAQVLKMLRGKNIEEINFDCSILDKVQVSEILLGFLLKNYNYNEFKKISKKNKINIKEINVKTKNINVDFDKIMFEANSVKKVRDFVNSPPCKMVPMHFAKEIKNWLEPLGVVVKILVGNEIEQMGLLKGVGQASVNSSCVVLMELNAEKNDLIALIGKGVTYDTGGLSLKASIGMEGMKADMAGAAAVVGAIANIAKNSKKIGVIGLVGLVENAVAGNAIKPDDILISYSKKTVEIINTDAEGRLVLADLISYAQEKYRLKKIVDVATLTGAIITALGNSYAGVFSNDEQMAKCFEVAGKKTEELTWHMPLHEEYSKAMNSNVADIKNCSASGAAGSATAAAFLQYFVDKDIKWAHLDIAGVAFLKKEGVLSDFGATGFGIRLIKDFVENN